MSIATVACRLEWGSSESPSASGSSSSLSAFQWPPRDRFALGVPSWWLSICLFCSRYRHLKRPGQLVGVRASPYQRHPPMHSSAFSSAVIDMIVTERVRSEPRRPALAWAFSPSLRGVTRNTLHVELQRVFHCSLATAYFMPVAYPSRSCLPDPAAIAKSSTVVVVLRVPPDKSAKLGAHCAVRSLSPPSWRRYLHCHRCHRS